MKPLINESGWTQIREAIDEAERRSVAEIVVMVVPRSASYAYQRLAGALLLMMIAAFATMVSPVHIPLEFFALGEVLLVAILWWVCGLPPILMAFTPDHIEKRAVERNAKILFIDRGLSETTHRTGVLLLISELERRVHVFADRGIYERVKSNAWSEMVGHVTRAIRMGHPTKGICEAINMITGFVERNVADLPRIGNELPNDPVIG